MTRGARRHAATALVLALAGCASPAPRAAPAPLPVAGGASAEDAAMAAEVARLVNEHRVRAGCRPLAWDAAAARAAQGHSDDMARRGYFDDVSPEGKGVGDRVRAAGARWVAVAENIASGRSTPAEVVQGWLASPEHRGNIESCIYTRHGVGYRDGLWTHVFYMPL